MAPRFRWPGGRPRAEDGDDDPAGRRSGDASPSATTSGGTPADAAGEPPAHDPPADPPADPQGAPGPGASGDPGTAPPDPSEDDLPQGPITGPITGPIDEAATGPIDRPGPDGAPRPGAAPQRSSGVIDLRPEVLSVVRSVVRSEAQALAAARARGVSADPADTAELGPIGDRIAEEIRDAAASGRAGAVHLVGDPGGLVYVADGRVLHIETWTTPGAELLILRRALDQEGWGTLLASLSTREGRDRARALASELIEQGRVSPVECDVAALRAMADAAGALLASSTAAPVRSRFLRAKLPWLTPTDPPTVDMVVVEARRQRSLLGRMARRIGPDTRVVRATRIDEPAVRLTPAQWDLVTLADRRSPRDLAWLLGRGVLATTLDVVRLERLGLVGPADASSRP